MKNIIIMVVAGVGLFVGTVVGLLGATGRLNYEGTQSLPVLSGLFEPPPPEEEGEGHEGDAHGGDVAAGEGHADAAHADGEQGHGAAQPPRNFDKAHSGSEELEDIFAPEDVAGGGGHGGGHGEEPAAHGDETHGEAHDNGHRVLDDIFAAEEAGGGGGHGGGHGGGEHAGADDAAHGETTHRDLSALEQHNQRPGAGESPLEKEHRYVMEALQNATDYEYETGRFFDFKGHTASISPDEINRFVALLEKRSRELDAKITSLDARSTELRDRERDVVDQQQALAAARQELQERQAQFDRQVEEFNRKVQVIQRLEEPGLRENAKALESLELELSAGWVMDNWTSPDGQTEVLKTMHFMSKEGANKLLGELGRKDLQLMKEILAKRKELAIEEPGKD